MAQLVWEQAREARKEGIGQELGPADSGECRTNMQGVRCHNV